MVENPHVSKTVAAEILSLSKSNLDVELASEYGITELDDNLKIVDPKERDQYILKLTSQLKADNRTSVDVAKIISEIRKTGQLYMSNEPEETPINGSSYISDGIRNLQ